MNLPFKKQKNAQYKQSQHRQNVGERVIYHIISSENVYKGYSTNSLNKSDSTGS